MFCLSVAVRELMATWLVSKRQSGLLRQDVFCKITGISRVRGVFLIGISQFVIMNYSQLFDMLIVLYFMNNSSRPNRD